MGGEDHLRAVLAAGALKEQAQQLRRQRRMQARVQLVHTEHLVVQGDGKPRA